MTGENNLVVETCGSNNVDIISMSTGKFRLFQVALQG